MVAYTQKVLTHFNLRRADKIVLILGLLFCTLAGPTVERRISISWQIKSFMKARFRGLKRGQIAKMPSLPAVTK